VSLLERLGDLLVEIHGQHEHQRLMEPARQLEVLDRFAGCEETRAKLAALCRRWETARAELARIHGEAREGARKEELYRWEISEIDAVQLREGEEDELRAERRRLQNAERIFAGLQEVMGLLHEDPQAAGAGLGRAASLLRELSRFDPDAATPIEALEGAQAYVEDAVARARGLRDRAVMDPERLRQIDERLDAIGGVKRKYGETAAAIAAYRKRSPGALDGSSATMPSPRRPSGMAAAAEGAAREAAVLSEGAGGGGAASRAADPAQLRSLGMEHAASARRSGAMPPGKGTVGGPRRLAARSPWSGDGRVPPLGQLGRSRRRPRSCRAASCPGPCWRSDILAAAGSAEHSLRRGGRGDRRRVADAVGQKLPADRRAGRQLGA
jgi:DNA repair protein RecN (Recombination protein N)